MAALLGTPADVIKTRVMNQPHEGGRFGVLFLILPQFIDQSFCHKFIENLKKLSGCFISNLFCSSLSEVFCTRRRWTALRRQFTMRGLWRSTKALFQYGPAWPPGLLPSGFHTNRLGDYLEHLRFDLHNSTCIVLLSLVRTCVTDDCLPLYCFVCFYSIAFAPQCNYDLYTWLQCQHFCAQ